ncbi:MAG: Rieske (2Fe-2S) protein [Alphaproteobacteria bacterium]|nr:Rieske (2Fe-2S) protein [Alphaproteobacteria bacterium]
MNRRQLLQGFAALCSGCAGAGRGGRDTGGTAGDTADSGSCTSPTAGGPTDYCLIEPVVVRVRDGATLAEGQTMLGLVDDTTAVIVGRDGSGFFARSAICTHACCVVNLCDDDACGSILSSPGPCESAGPASGGTAFCPCHGSMFRISDGAALNGPATTPLPAYAVTIDGSDLLVDTGLQVSPSDRVPS